jgi:hypothetical protein
MGSKMVHHITFFVKFLTASIKATIEDGIQSLGIFIHDFFPVIGHPLSFAFLETIIQDLQFMEEVFD